MCKDDSGCPPLHRPDLAPDNFDFLIFRSECWCASASLACRQTRCPQTSRLADALTTADH